MRKRSKKRISQEERPWIKVSSRKDEEINIFNKITSHWHSGNRRHNLNKKLNNYQYKHLSNLGIASLMQDTFDSNKNTIYFNTVAKGTMLHQRLIHKYYFSTFTNLNAANNFCLFLGKSSTYNRQVFASRQTVRKLMKTGLLIGMQKK